MLFTDYDDKLERLRESIQARPADEPILTSVRIAVLSLAELFEQDREQMMLKAQLMDTPALRARSIERQADWHGVVAGAIRGPERVSTLRPTFRPRSSQPRRSRPYRRPCECGSPPAARRTRWSS